ncbi:ATP-binding cassette domain-containing protein, partial [Escherichia coli]|nr:ATP-binding cassette domain-containing protein [Escherichia coli]
KVQVKDLHKSYGENEVLKGIDLAVKPSEVVCMIGPSGSGKSTFLRCLNRLEVPNSGHIYIDGYDIADPKTDINLVRQNIGMVFQHFNLFPNMSVIDNITLAPVELKKM